MRILITSLGLLLCSQLLANDFHPAFPLLDKDGQPVVESGAPLSTLTTCGSCHDSGYIQAHSDHANAGAEQIGVTQKTHDWAAGNGYYGAWNALDYDVVENKNGRPDPNAWLQRYGARHVGGGPVADQIEMDCLLCHTNVSDTELRKQAIQSGDNAWANSVLLTEQNILQYADQQWRWNKSLFDETGAVAAKILPIRKPTDENCGQCHGLVNNELNQPLKLAADWQSQTMTVKTGQIFSPQKLNMTGLNLSDKKALTRSIDVHIDRVVGCVNCHYSLNNPVYYQRFDENQPKHLIFDPRRLSVAEYLERPLHQFAKGSSSHGLASVTENSLRRCESCHAADVTHNWLPYKERHFAVVSCESCHIPELYGPTLMSVDWTLPSESGQANLVYRNSSNDLAASSNLMTAFEPILLPRQNVSGEQKLAPFNLITGWLWLSGEPELPVARQQLLDAFTVNGKYRPELVAEFDVDADGSLSDLERRLDSEQKVAILTAALEKAGVVKPRIYGETSAYAISHNVVNGKWATKDCQSCHNKDSRVDGNIVLASYSPGGMTPEFAKAQGTDFSGTMTQLDDGSIHFNANANDSGFYVLGLDSVPLVDIFGMLIFFGISFGVTAHAIARKIANRKLGHIKHNYRREYIYDAYERLWHWLQAGSILILLVTGLVIHKPHIFGIFSFSYMVEVHNVVGFILLINAALALFYNLASGEIKQYLPEPKGFIGRTMAQAMYYSKGIFQGANHPNEKSAEHKMNPLQQVTYLAILNLLLPAQVITGVLIWGAQRWPEISAALGGLVFLAPLHTLLAWSFAAFIVMHVYLTTTGHTPMGGIKSMIEGWDEVEDLSGDSSSKS